MSGEPAAADPASLRTLRLLKEDGFAETRLVEFEGEKWVHKVFRLRFWWGRPFQPLARWSMRREFAICRSLAGVEGVAADVIPVDDHSFLRRWVEGTDLKASRREGCRPDAPFFDRVGVILKEVHARGIAYNDLAKQDNVIVTPDQWPVLIDFQIAIRRYEGRSRLRRALSDWWISRLQREDLRHLVKLKWRVRQDLISPQEEALVRRRSLLAKAYRVLIRVPFHAVKRLIYPKGSNETFRFSRKGPRGLGS